uniref:Uncharacterized protein n=1 Tax=Anguilla anguilla TaxID=7936 RepID=A0A0E9TPQ6_ANGAN
MRLKINVLQLDNP